MNSFQDFGSGNYQASLLDNSLVCVGPVEDCWNHEWHHGPGGIKEGFVKKTDDLESIMAEYKKRCRERFELNQRIDKMISDKKKRERKEYQRLTEKYGKSFLIEMFNSYTKIEEEIDWEDFQYVYHFDKKVLMLRRIDENNKVVLDISINKNGNLIKR